VRLLADKTSLKKSQKEVKQYLKDLRSDDLSVRANAAYMLGVLGKNDKSVKRSLTKALKDPSWEVRKWAALSLGEIGDRESTLIPTLIEILKRDDSTEFKSHAAVILGELEKRAASAIPALHQALQDENKRVRDWAIWALQKISGEKPRYRQQFELERPKLSERLRFEKPKPKQKIVK